VTRVAVVDYGAGNLGNARRAVVALGFEEVRVRSPAELGDVGPIVLPGVGAYGAAIARLEATGLAAALRAAVGAGRPIVGICLGLQLLYQRSEESDGVEGLGVLRGRVRRLRAGGLPLPHLGWAPVGTGDRAYYFAHSFCVEPDDAGDVIATARWGEPFVAAVRRGAVVGFQFHPERSGPAGLALLARALRGEDPTP
jgi:glutamine amidotransferase/cyclase